MIEDETVQQVRRAIEKLPEHFRAALVLCEYENMSYQQIAEALNASVPQVKTWIHRARRRTQTRTLADALYGKAGMTEAQVADLNEQVKALRDAFRT